jgi:iron-sulfur cluster repair protein YtfE (RIC family)
MTVAKMTISLDSDLKESMGKYPKINWSSVCAEAIKMKIVQMEQIEELSEELILELCQTTNDPCLVSHIVYTGLNNIEDDVLHHMLQVLRKDKTQPLTGPLFGQQKEIVE